MINKRLLQIINVLAIVFLIGAGFWLRFDNLGKIDFQNDEYYHLQAAAGYVETGDFVKWDFIEEQPTGEYIRAWPYTWLVAQSFKIFGISEWSARFPSLIFGLLFLPLIYLLAYKITKNKLASLLILTLAVFDSSLIWSSRLSRMYSMLVFFSSLSTYLIYLGLEERYKKKIIKYLLLAGGILLLGFSYLIHEVVLILILGFIIYFIINSLNDLKQKKYSLKNKNYLLSLFFIVSLIIGLAVNYLITPLISGDFITLRSAPNYEYFTYIFNQLRLPNLAWLFLFLGLFLWPKFNKLKIYYLSLIIPTLLFFIFIADRYAAKKYILFIVPFFAIFYVAGLTSVWQEITTKKYLLYPGIIITFLIIGPLFSWPGVESNLFFQQARVDHDYQNFEYHNFDSAYSHIEQNYKSSEPILIVRQHPYYFSRQDLNLINLKTNKEFTLKELKEVTNDNPTGWVVWPKYKDYHLKNNIIEYCQENLTRITELKDTNVKVYYWNNIQ